MGLLKIIIIYFSSLFLVEYDWRFWSNIIIRGTCDEFISHQIGLDVNALLELFPCKLLLFHGCGIGDSGTSSLSEALKVNSSLIQLNLREWVFNVVGFKTYRPFDWQRYR